MTCWHWLICLEWPIIRSTPNDNGGLAKFGLPYNDFGLYKGISVVVRAADVLEDAGSLEGRKMISQRRSAQIGLAAAFVVLITSFGILAVQGDNSSSITKDAALTNQQTQTSALPVAMSLSARTHAQLNSPQQ